MRFLLIVTTLCACRSPRGAATPLPAAPETSQPRETVEPGPASACFAEPVIYRRMIPAELPDREIEGRLRACDAARDAQACRFAIAREYADGRRYERAAPLLLQLAHGARSSLAADAAELALESLDALASRTNPPRPACYDLIESEVPKLLDELCTPLPVVGGKRVCATLYAADVDMTRCSECVTGSVSGRDPVWEQLTAARLLLETATEQCVFGRGHQKINEPLRCDELLYRAYRLYLDGGSEGHAREVSRRLLDPNNGLDQTEPALRLKEHADAARRLRKLFDRGEGVRP